MLGNSKRENHAPLRIRRRPHSTRYLPAGSPRQIKQTANATATVTATATDATITTTTATTTTNAVETETAINDYRAGLENCIPVQNALRRNGDAQQQTTVRNEFILTTQATGILTKN